MQKRCVLNIILKRGGKEMDKETYLLLENELTQIINKYKNLETQEPPFDYTIIYNEVIDELQKVINNLKENK